MSNRKKAPFRRTKIVATIGPATGTPEVIADLIKAGMNIARLNLSHGTLDDHAEYIARVRSESDRAGIPVAILIDIPGPKYRSGPLSNPVVQLRKGEPITLTTKQVVGNSSLVSVNLPTFPDDVKPGDIILVDDGSLQLKCDTVKDTDVGCTVLVGGPLTAGRGIAVPGKTSSMPFMTGQLQAYIEFAVSQKPDFIALSFVSRAEDLIQVRDLIKKKNADLPLVAKIERGTAVKVFDAILAESDAVMVARGDLGVDIPLERLPLVQKEIIHKSNRAGKPVITATQMLESMINSPRPTRAEVSDVSNAIFDGTDAVMLSAETSIGKYPVQAVSMMAAVAVETEKDLPYDQWIAERDSWLSNQTEELISYNACLTARRLESAAIVAFTSSGSTAGRVSKYRPSTPILAISPNIDTCRRLILNWGVQAQQISTPETVDDLFSTAVDICKKINLAETGQNIIVTGGIPLGKAGTTNLLKVQEID
ncbi:pyruvate kinase [Dehalogenimonas formicexedens]|uniref:Pyruvate kinase n=1 Tax=Dehalogenimonas formicexedens TaxID=1839801 RepID=A0A1P8F5Y5_9CHLR|nr:pyruvate kinase [Dehalogenimonas formicexedens]APV43891.1 pyruvate kinase [Dehalogenimonas formicexedens]